MNNSILYIISIIKYYLKAYKIAFKEKDVYKVLTTDPDFPSLAAISKTLNYFGLETSAYQLNHEEDYNNLRNNIIHATLGDGHFFIIQKVHEKDIVLYDGQKHTINKEQFQRIWNGVILNISSSQETRTSTPNKHLWSRATSIIFLACAFYILHLHLTTPTIFFLCLSCIGMAFSVFMIKQRIELLSNDKFCKIGKIFDCKTVTRRQPLIDKNWPHLDEMGCFYFAWCIVYLCIAKHIDLLLTSICMVSSLTCIFLLAYQSFAIKKFCILCLGTYAIIWASLFTSWLYPVTSINIKDCLYIGGTATFISYIISRMTSQHLQQKERTFENEIKTLKIKRNTSIFSMLTNHSKKLDLQNIKGKSYGNKDAHNRIALIVSLDCKFCKKAIEEATRLTEHFPYRFNCKIITINDISAYWNTHEDISNLVLDKLPVITINEKEMPQLYEISDYQYLLN